MHRRDRRYDEYEIGETRTTFGRTITEADIVAHAGQTGDFFPHHMDAAWCAAQPFAERIAHGTLIMSIAVGMTASEINTHAMSYGYDTIRFVKPVLIGDTITVSAEITRTVDHPRRPTTHGLVHELMTVRNQRDDTVLVLTHLYLVNKSSG